MIRKHFFLILKGPPPPNIKNKSRMYEETPALEVFMQVSLFSPQTETLYFKTILAEIEIVKLKSILSTQCLYQHFTILSCILYPVSCILYPVTCIMYHVPCSLYPVLCILYPVSYILQYPVS